VRANADIPTIMKISGQKNVAMVLCRTQVDGEHIDIAAATRGADSTGSTHHKS
jgi:hypothetical protein